MRSTGSTLPAPTLPSVPEVHAGHPHARRLVRHDLAPVRGRVHAVGDDRLICEIRTLTKMSGRPEPGCTRCARRACRMRLAMCDRVIGIDEVLIAVAIVRPHRQIAGATQREHISRTEAARAPAKTAAPVQGDAQRRRHGRHTRRSRCTGNRDTRRAALSDRPVDGAAVTSSSIRSPRRHRRSLQCAPPGTAVRDADLDIAVLAEEHGRIYAQSIVQPIALESGFSRLAAPDSKARGPFADSAGR